MKLNLKWEIPQLMMISAMFALAAWRWPLTGDRVPVHWGLDGQIDRYGGKFEGLLLLPLLSLGLYALALALPKFDPGRANYAQFGASYGLIRAATTALMLGLHIVILLVTAGVRVDVPRVMLLAIGVLFLVMGGVSGKIRPNWFFGIRTPWTLSSKTAWVKTHRAGGWTFIVVGALQILGGLFLPREAALGAMLTLLLGSSLGLSAYSFWVWREADDQAPPANTLPAD